MLSYNAIVDDECASTRTTAVTPLSCERRSQQLIQSWDGYAFAYREAFEELARVACERYPRQDYLWIPLAYMARHSIELSLKATLRDLGFNDQSFLSGHKILKLLNKMNEMLRARRMDGGSNWMKRCRNWINEFEALDKTSELLRYPSDRTDKAFPGFEIDLESLIRAHSTVTMLCDCVSTALSEADNITYRSALTNLQGYE